MLQLSELRNRSEDLFTRFASFWGRLDLEGQKERLLEIESALARPGAWDNPDALTPMLQEKSQLDVQVQNLEDLQKRKEDLEEWLAFAEEEQSSEILQALEDNLRILENKLERAEIEALLSGAEDKASAILEIHPGAGGTEAQDWAEMLLRMYKRWAERQEFKVEYLDYLPGDEAGVKSVVLQISGPFCYGLLKSEKGIHRLIRISPFDTSGRRHTSFASVDVYPQVSDDIDIDVREDDLRIDVFRSSGPGGQHVNKTSSAIRITHLPTGVVAQCQNERSQSRNKEAALKFLKAKLYEIEVKKQEMEKQSEYENKESIAWGSQIRTYTLQPYRLVKDHRTNTESGNVDAVLDGDIDSFMRGFLLMNYAK
ncbi:MAG: peptide chain release factor 2 [Desulfovibrionales bacterium]